MELTISYGDYPFAEPISFHRFQDKRIILTDTRPTTVD